MPPRKKTPTATKKIKRPVGVIHPTVDPSEKKDEEYRSPVAILETMDIAIKQLADAVVGMQEYNTQAQDILTANMGKMVDHINKQTITMNDFALQVQKLTRHQNVFGDLGNVMSEMQGHLAEEKEVMRINKRELKAQTKEAVHYLDKLRNLLIDFHHYWREE